ncbi:four helix bundle protein [Ralstonia solanacearum]|uniref:four helix bundle protein n=1 Tax=Ralstonia solanacearum TaxID=305 RepID=UPI000E66A72C|nr:four helix bundle protein [Ralstonia solanacearum]RIJ84970.1 four helix bundle protein [Ralstonia solanacearum]
MALHTELDIYKTGYDLFGKVTMIVANMERTFKRLIGEEIVRESSKLLILVYRANVAEDKVPHLANLVERVKLVELLIRLSFDMKKVSPKQYWAVTKLTESISKQATAWKKYAAKRPFHGGQGHHD